MKSSSGAGMMANIKRRPQPFNSSPAQVDLPWNAVVLPDRLRGCRLMRWPQEEEPVARRSTLGSIFAAAALCESASGHII